MVINLNLNLCWLIFNTIITCILCCIIQTQIPISIIIIIIAETCFNEKKSFDIIIS
jgi:hypothetical protein